MNYRKEIISDLDVERIKSDSNEAAWLYYLTSKNWKNLHSRKWAVDQEENSYLFIPPLAGNSEDLSIAYVFYFSSSMYELSVLGMINDFKVMFDSHDAKPIENFENVQKAFVSAVMAYEPPGENAKAFMLKAFGTDLNEVSIRFSFTEKKRDV